MNQKWDARSDRRLISLRERGCSFQAIADSMGVTRDAAKSRFYRLTDRQFPSDARRQAARSLDLVDPAQILINP